MDEEFDIPEIGEGERMIEAMKLIPTQSGKLMRNLFSPAWAANISSWVVVGKDGECPSRVAYEFSDGTAITWTRQKASA